MIVVEALLKEEGGSLELPTRYGMYLYRVGASAVIAIRLVIRKQNMRAVEIIAYFTQECRQFHFFASVLRTE